MASLERVLDLEPKHKQAGEELGKLKERLTPPDATGPGDADGDELP